MKDNIVLGYPYEGSFYWLLSAERWRDTSIKRPYKGGDSYYSWLYGTAPQKYIDQTASLCILYNKVLLAPADNYMPDHQKYQSGDRYYHPELGVLSDWSWYPRSNEFKQFVDLVSRQLANDESYKNIERYALSRIVTGALIQLIVASNNKADIMGDAKYVKLCTRIQSLTGLYKDVVAKNAQDTILKDMKMTYKLSGLHFSLNNLDEFIALRKNKALIKFGETFRKTISNLPVSPEREAELLKTMLEAIESSEVARRISSELSVTATATGYLSLIPFVGTLAGIESLASDHGAKVADHVRFQKSWWMLAPKIAETLNKARIEQRLKELGS